MDIDAALAKVGEYGTLQRRILWTMCVPQAFIAWQHMQNVFTGAEPRLTCIRGNVETEGCPKVGEASCDSYAYSHAEFTSTASEWNLVCNQAYKTDLLQSFYMAALLFGNLAGGFIADQYGRRRLVCFSVLAITFLSLIALFAQSYEGYMIWRLLSALATGSYGLVSFTLPTELVGAEQRGFVNLLATVSYALGIGTLSIVAYFFRDWRTMSVITALPGLIGLYYYRSVPESPRWLLSQGRVEESEKVLDHIAAVNFGAKGISAIQPIKLQPPPPTSIQKKGGQTVGGGSILDLLRHSMLCRRTSANVFTWFVTAMVYLGLTLRAGSLGTDRYLSFALSGLIEIPADFLAVWCMDRYGRRWTYTWSLLAGGVSSLLIACIPLDFAQMTTLLAFCGKTGIAMSFCVCWIHAAEMYPTNIRNKALSVCNTASRIGGVIAPLVLTLGRIHSNTDWMVFGGLAVFAALFSRALPETLNRPMPEVIEDIDRESEREKIGSSKVGQCRIIEVKAMEGKQKSKAEKLEEEIRELEKCSESPDL